MYIIYLHTLMVKKEKDEKKNRFIYIYILRRRNERETTRTMREAKITLIIMC
jgi:hypothetical protein